MGLGMGGLPGGGRATGPGSGSAVAGDDVRSETTFGNACGER
jgi:hypothetical protein